MNQIPKHEQINVAWEHKGELHNGRVIGWRWGPVFCKALVVCSRGFFHKVRRRKLKEIR